jgi:large conductance mechanosensitive channel
MSKSPGGAKVTALVGKTGDFTTFSFKLRNQSFNMGDLINQAISFLLVAAAVYFFVVMPVNALLARMHKDEPAPAPTTKKCPECLRDIPIEARRCAHGGQPVSVSVAA